MWGNILRFCLRSLLILVVTFLTLCFLSISLYWDTPIDSSFAGYHLTEKMVGKIFDSFFALIVITNVVLGLFYQALPKGSKNKQHFRLSNVQLVTVVLNLCLYALWYMTNVITIERHTPEKISLVGLPILFIYYMPIVLISILVNTFLTNRTTQSPSFINKL